MTAPTSPHTADVVRIVADAAKPLSAHSPMWAEFEKSLRAEATRLSAQTAAGAEPREILLGPPPWKASPTAGAVTGELRACPWCDGPVHSETDNHPAYPGLVHCPNGLCPVRPEARGETEAEAIAAWNTRARTPAAADGAGGDAGGFIELPRPYRLTKAPNPLDLQNVWLPDGCYQNGKMIAGIGAIVPPISFLMGDHAPLTDVEIANMARSDVSHVHRRAAAEILRLRSGTESG